MSKELKPIHKYVLALFQSQTILRIYEGTEYQTLNYKI